MNTEDSGVKLIMLIDDNKLDNFFHERVIRKFSSDIDVLLIESGAEALEYLGRCDNIIPNLIFLDINMPGMNGWEFLEKYRELDDVMKSCMVVVMLTTSENPDDKAKAEKFGFVTEFKNKPLTRTMLEEIFEFYKKNKVN